MRWASQIPAPSLFLCPGWGTASMAHPGPSVGRLGCGVPGPPCWSMASVFPRPEGPELVPHHSLAWAGSAMPWGCWRVSGSCSSWGVRPGQCGPPCRDCATACDHLDQGGISWARWGWAFLPPPCHFPTSGSSFSTAAVVTAEPFKAPSFTPVLAAAGPASTAATNLAGESAPGSGPKWWSEGLSGVAPGGGGWGWVLLSLDNF